MKKLLLVLLVLLSYNLSATDYKLSNIDGYGWIAFSEEKKTGYLFGWLTANTALRDWFAYDMGEEGNE